MEEMEFLNDIEDLKDSKVVKLKVVQLMDELTALCKHRNQLFPLQSIQTISTQYQILPIVLHASNTSSKSGSTKKSNEKQRVEELTRFFMEGRSGEQSLSSMAQRSLLLNANEHTDDTTIQEEEVINVHPKLFSPMLSVIRQREPLLCGAIVCHPFVNRGKDEKMEKSEKVDASEKLDVSEIGNELEKLVEMVGRELSMKNILFALKVILWYIGEGGVRLKVKECLGRMKDGGQKVDEEKTKSEVGKEEQLDSMAALSARLTRFVNQAERQSGEGSEMDEEALMAQAIALSLSSDSNVQEEQNDVVEDSVGKEKVFVRPLLFSGEEIRGFSMEEEEVDLLDVANHLVAKLNEYCHEYIVAAKKQLNMVDSKMDPHPLTFLLIVSLIQDTKEMPEFKDGKSGARYNLLANSLAFVLLRTLDVLFFHIDVNHIAPASVGLGHSKVEHSPEIGNNSVVKQLKNLTMGYFDHKVHMEVEEKDHIGILLQNGADASDQMYLDAANVYRDALAFQALSTWAKGIPHFYNRHSERRQLLLSLLKSCNIEPCGWKHAQLDLLSARLALPDMVCHFVPEEDESNTNGDPEDPIEEEDIDIDVESIPTDDSLRIAHAGIDKVHWSPNQVYKALISGKLSKRLLIEYLKERDIEIQTNDTDGLMVAYDLFWEKHTSDKSRPHEVLTELPTILASLQKNISETKHTKSAFSKNVIPMAPLFRIRGIDNSINLQKLKSPQHRLLLLRSIQDFMVQRISGISNNEPTPPEFDPNRCADTITLSNDKRTAKQHSSKQWGAVMISKGCSPNTGIHEWAVRLDKCEKGHIFIGVCTRDASVSTYVGGDRQGWGLIGTRALWHNRGKVRGDYGDGFSTGTTLRIRLNTDSGALTFGVNESDWGVAFDGLTSCGTLYPAVGLYQRDDQITVLPVQNEFGKKGDLSPASAILNNSHSYALPRALPSFLQYTISILQYSIDALEQYKGENFGIQVKRDRILSSILPPLLSSLSLLTPAFGVLGVVATQALPLCMAMLKQLQNTVSSLKLHHQLMLNISGNWELKSSAAGIIPAQQYRVKIKQSKGCLIGKSSGSMASVSLKGSIEGTKVRFFETWRQGGTCVVEGRLEYDGNSFSGTYHDTKSNTCGSITGCKLSSTSNLKLSAFSTGVKVYEGLAALLASTIGKYCGALILGDHIEIGDEYHVESSETRSSDDLMLDTTEILSKSEISQSKYAEWVDSDLLSGGLPMECVKDHLQSIVQRTRNLTNSIFNNLDSKELNEAWLSEATAKVLELPVPIQDDEAVEFLSELVASRNVGKIVDGVVLRHVGESPFLRIGGENMKIARRAVVGAMLWHSGCVQEAMQIAENTNSRPHERIMLIWRAAQRVIEWAIRSKNETGSDYSTIAKLVIQRSKFLLTLNPPPSTLEVMGVSVDEKWEDLSTRVHSEVLMKVSRFLEASIRISNLRTMMLSSYTKILFKILGLRSAYNVFDYSNDSKNALIMPYATGAIVQWVAASLNADQPNLGLAMNAKRQIKKHASSDRAYYCAKLGGSGYAAVALLRNNFEKLYEKLASFLHQSEWSKDYESQLGLLQCWGIFIRPQDHNFLSRVGIFRTLQSILDGARISHSSTNLDYTGMETDHMKRVVQAALKVVHLLAAQVAGDSDTEVRISPYNRIPLSREVSGPGTLGESVFNMLYVELKNGVEELLEQPFAMRASMKPDQKNSSKNHMYCSQICDLLYSVSGTSVCCTFLSTSKWLQLLIALIDNASPNIQRRVLRLLRRLLPEIDPRSLRLQLSTRPISLVDIESDNEDVMQVSQDEKPTGLPLLEYLLDIIGASLPHSLARQEVFAAGSSESSFTSHIFNIPFNGVNTLANETVILLRTLYKAARWKILIDNMALGWLQLASKSLPHDFTFDGEVLAADLSAFADYDNVYRRAYAVLSTFGGYVDGFQTGGTVKILPKSGSSLQEIAFRGATGLLGAYDSQKSSADVLISSTLNQDAPSSKSAVLTSIRVPVEDLCPTSEIDCDTATLCDDIGRKLCTSMLDRFVKDLSKSLEESSSIVAKAKDAEDPVPLQSSDDTTEERRNFASEIQDDIMLSKLVLCFHGFRSITKTLGQQRFSSYFVSNSMINPERLHKLFKIAVSTTSAKGLSDITSLENSWLELRSAWFNLRRIDINSIINPAVELDKNETNVEEPSLDCKQMMEMGFPKEWCDIALLKCSGNVESAINFCFEHSGDMERLLAEAKNAQSGKNNSAGRAKASPRNALLDQLSEMGFPLNWCKKALECNRNNVDAALTWILSNGEMLEAEDRRTENSLNASTSDSKDVTCADSKYRSDLLKVVSGQASVSKDCTVEGLAGGGFASVGARNCLVSRGRWYYEATLNTSGCIQIGWADVAFAGSSDRGDGVGDGSHSWAFDGWRQQKWHGASAPWGSKWSVGDVVGCGVDLDAGAILFSLNGKMVTAGMGIAFSGIQYSGGVYPCASFNRREKLQFNLGMQPFQFPPPKGFRPIVEGANVIANDDVALMEDCLEEAAGEEHYSRDSRYFGKESHAIFRAAALNHRSGAIRLPGLPLDLSKMDKNEVYNALKDATRSLAVLHARRALLTLLSKWPTENRSSEMFSKINLDLAPAPDVVESSHKYGLLICFIKLVSSLNGQLSKSPSLGVTRESPFVDLDIARLIDSGASGHNALFLLTPLVRETILQELKANNGNISALIGNMLDAIKLQVASASERQYSKIAWDSTDVASNLLHLSPSSVTWTDRESLKHPNMVFAEWLSMLLMECSKSYFEGNFKNPIRLHLFRSWSICLRSAGMGLKDKGTKILSILLHDAMSHECKSISELQAYLETLPVKRIKCLTMNRLQMERRNSPVFSKYMQNLMELVCAIELYSSTAKTSDSMQNKVDTSQSLNEILLPIHANEVEYAREQKKVNDMKVQEEKDTALVESECPDAEKTDSTNAQPSDTDQPSGDVIVEESKSEIADSSLINLQDDENESKEAGDVVSSLANEIMMIQKRIISASPSLRMEVSKPQDATKMLAVKNGEFIFPDPVPEYDTSQLGEKDIQLLKLASFGHMGQENDSWLYGYEPGILADIPETICYSGVLTLHATKFAKSSSPPLSVGSRVIRGPDWKWRDQDGGEGSVGIIETISPWSGVEGEGMAVRWPNDTVFTYRWGADGKHDLVHVEVEDDTGEIVTKYPTPEKVKYDGTFGSGLQTGIILNIYENLGNATGSEIPFSGIMEYPDFFGASVRVVGARSTEDGSFWFQELQLVRGYPSMSWLTRCGSEKWQPGTKYVMHTSYSESDSSRVAGEMKQKVICDGRLQDLRGEVELSQNLLFKMDRMSHFSSITISDDGLSATCTGGESRALAIGTVGFTTGIHYWELRVDQAEFGSVFLGVCEKAGPPGSQALQNSRLNRWNGWGFVNFRATYHNSTERIYGDHFNAGDTIGILLDMEAGKISFFMDGIKYGEHIVADLGVAFDNLQNDRTGTKKTMFPCIGLRKAGDKISISGKWLSSPSLPNSYLYREAVDTAKMLHGWISEQEHAFSESCLHAAWLEYKRWSKSRWVRFPARPRGVVIDFDTSERICRDVCQKAGLSAPFFSGDRVRICSSGGRELDQPEEAIILGVYRGALWYRTETQGNEGADEGRIWAWYWSAAELQGIILILRNGKDMTLLENSASDIVKTKPSLKLLPEEENALKSFSDFVTMATKGWTNEMDISLVGGINLLCVSVGVETNSIQFQDVVSPQEQLDRTSRNHFSHSSLRGISGSQLRARFSVLKVLNGQILRMLPLINIDSADKNIFSESTSMQLCSTGKKIQLARDIIFTNTKKMFWDALLRSTTTSTPLPSDEYEDPREIRAIRINRIQAQANKLALLPQPGDRLRKSVFGQLYREMRTWSDSAFRRAYCGKGHGGQKRAFKVKFLGEGVNDYGGPYRAVFDQIVDELQMDNIELTKGEQGLLPLLVPCPNRRSGAGSNQDKFMLNPACGTSSIVNGPVALEWYRFLGRMIGTAVRHGLQMGLDLPCQVWRPLTGLTLNRAHLETIDATTSNLLSRIDAMEEESEENLAHLDCLNFTTHLSDGTEALLCPFGKDLNVTWDQRSQYVCLVESKRATESVQQLTALKNGLATVLPMEITPLFSPSELEVLICGRQEVDVALLKQCTEYEEIDENTPHVIYFWQVLEEMSNEERTKFLRFVWARSRMPNSVKDFPMNFKLQAAHYQGARTSPDLYLPHAQTCFFSLSLPAYTSKEILRKKLIFAIENSPNMDADVRLHNAEGWADA